MKSQYLFCITLGCQSAIPNNMQVKTPMLIPSDAIKPLRLLYDLLKMNVGIFRILFSLHAKNIGAHIQTESVLVCTQQQLIRTNFAASNLDAQLPTFFELYSSEVNETQINRKINSKNVLQRNFFNKINECIFMHKTIREQTLKSLCIINHGCKN